MQTFADLAACSDRVLAVMRKADTPSLLAIERQVRNLRAAATNDEDRETCDRLIGRASLIAAERARGRRPLDIANEMRSSR